MEPHLQFHIFLPYLNTSKIQLRGPPLLSAAHLQLSSATCCHGDNRFLYRCVAALHPQSPGHFAWQPSAQVSQTLRLPPTPVTWLQLLRKQTNTGTSTALTAETYWSTLTRLHTLSRHVTSANVSRAWGWRLYGIIPAIRSIPYPENRNLNPHYRPIFIYDIKNCIISVVIISMVFSIKGSFCWKWEFVASTYIIYGSMYRSRRKGYNFILWVAVQ